MTAPVVAIDGPAGAGKSTLARALAGELGLAYINTGLMYRAVTAEALRKGTPLADGAALADVARSLDFGLAGLPPELAVAGAPPGEELTTPAVEAAVSRVSSHSEVRAVMRERQRQLGSAGAVMEGRDIATVVFPDAALKIFLTASPAERAARRLEERGSRDPALAAELAARDERDERVNPFVPAPGAVTIDSSGRSAKEVLAEALALARATLGKK